MGSMDLAVCCPLLILVRRAVERLARLAFLEQCSLLLTNYAAKRPVVLILVVVTTRPSMLVRRAVKRLSARHALQLLMNFELRREAARGSRENADDSSFLGGRRREAAAGSRRR